MKTILILFSVVLVSACEYKAIKWYTSTTGKQWEEQRNPIMYNTDTITEFDIEIFPDSVQQKIDGFGGCFNELGWDALNLLDTKTRKVVFKRLFTSNNGLDFNICRMPLGANDYSRNYYSLNDDSADYSMQHFNIERDKQTLIPYIKEAMQYKPDLKIWASPWTPPAWMKTNNHYACFAGEYNNLNPALNGKEGLNQMKTDSITLTSYALYFAKFIEAYKNEGINISAVHIQNEFNSCQIFPSCVWSSSALSTFIGKYLGPTFENNNINTQIWLGTIERPYIELIDTVLNNEFSAKYVKGLGFQWGGKGAIPAAHVKYPNMPLMQTETECGDGSNDWKAAEHTFGLMKHYFDNGANSYMYWNMILPENGLSNWGWKQNALFTVNTQTKELKISPEFYLFQHFCSYIKPGASKVIAKGKTNQTLVFKNSNNDLVAIIANNADSVIKTKIKVKNHYFKVQIKAHSFNTFVLK